MYTIIFSEDAKRLLDLAGCSARDFSSQIAHVSMVVIRYNILALIKRSDDYETIGGLFTDYMKAYTSSPSWKRSGQSLLML